MSSLMHLGPAGALDNLDARTLRELDATDTYRGRRKPGRPTNEPPGSEAKLAIMIERAERRESLFHPADTPLDRRAVRNLVVTTGAARRNAQASAQLSALESVDEHDLVPTAEELEVLELAREWERYDAISRSYIPGTPEWHQRRLRDAAWAAQGQNVSWYTGPVLVQEGR